MSELYPVPKPSRGTYRQNVLTQRRQQHGGYGPDWPAQRAAALARDGGRCQVCASRYRVEVHHIHRVGRRGYDPANNRLENLISLCWVDHGRAETAELGADDLRAVLHLAYGYRYAADGVDGAEGDAR